MSEIADFLASSPVFRELPLDQIEEIAPLFQRTHYPAGEIILRQGGHSDAVYFVSSGRLAARIQRGDNRETVAYLHPPDVFGELSFVTGRPCICDVEVDVDADIVVLPREAAAQLPKQRETIMRSLMQVIAGRLQETVTRGAKVEELPIIMLRNHPNWEAPNSFAAEFVRLLARETGRQTLLVNLGTAREKPIYNLYGSSSACDIPARSQDPALRSKIAQKLTEWKDRFENVVFNLVSNDGDGVAEVASQFTNWRGDLIGPGDAIPAVAGPSSFVVQSAASPTLPVLSGSRQLIADAAQAEEAYHSGRPAPARFRRTAGSIARLIAKLQVGLALGGGAAWGWAHIGVLSVLEEAGLPVDVISGCSMGSVIGALYCAGYSVNEMLEISEYWRTRTRRFIEWRFWRMSLLNEKRVLKAFRQYLKDRTVNQCEIPYWGNAVDIKSGKEYTIQSGTLTDCLRASIALPGLLPPVALSTHLLVDAGIMDPVPVPLLRLMGCHFAIGVNAMARLESQKMNTHYPFNAFDIMTRCMFVMGHEIGQARAEHAANVVFTPSLGDITMLQFSRSQEIIECGRKATEEQMPGILASYERLKSRFATQPPQPAAQEKR